MNRLTDSELHVIGETRVRVELCLITTPGRSLSELRSAASHPVALQQCLGFFRDQPNVVAVTVYDTAGSVRDLIAGDCEYDSAIAKTREVATVPAIESCSFRARDTGRTRARRSSGS